MSTFEVHGANYKIARDNEDDDDNDDDDEGDAGRSRDRGPQGELGYLGDNRQGRYNQSGPGEGGSRWESEQRGMHQGWRGGEGDGEFRPQMRPEMMHPHGPMDGPMFPGGPFNRPMFRGPQFERPPDRRELPPFGPRFERPGERDLPPFGPRFQRPDERDLHPFGARFERPDERDLPPFGQRFERPDERDLLPFGARFERPNGRDQPPYDRMSRDRSPPREGRSERLYPEPVQRPEAPAPAYVPPKTIDYHHGSEGGSKGGGGASGGTGGPIVSAQVINYDHRSRADIERSRSTTRSSERSQEKEMMAHMFMRASVESGKNSLRHQTGGPRQEQTGPGNHSVMDRQVHLMDRPVQQGGQGQVQNVDRPIQHGGGGSGGGGGQGERRVFEYAKQDSDLRGSLPPATSRQGQLDSQRPTEREQQQRQGDSQNFIERSGSTLDQRGQREVLPTKNQGAMERQGGHPDGMRQVLIDIQRDIEGLGQQGGQYPKQGERPGPALDQRGQREVSRERPPGGPPGEIRQSQPGGQNRTEIPRQAAAQTFVGIDFIKLAIVSNYC